MGSDVLAWSDPWTAWPGPWTHGRPGTLGRPGPWTRGWPVDGPARPVDPWTARPMDGPTYGRPGPWTRGLARGRPGPACGWPGSARAPVDGPAHAHISIVLPVPHHLIAPVLHSDNIK